jgi:hypothetical protein
MILAYAFNQVDILPAYDYHSMYTLLESAISKLRLHRMWRMHQLDIMFIGLEQIHVPPRAHATFDVETIFMEDLKCNGSPVYTTILITQIRLHLMIIVWLLQGLHVFPCYNFKPWVKTSINIPYQ